jgi:hypothetical protein
MLHDWHWEAPGHDRWLLQGGADQNPKIVPGKAAVQVAQLRTRSNATASSTADRFQPPTTVDHAAQCMRYVSTSILNRCT